MIHIIATQTNQSSHELLQSLKLGSGQFQLLPSLEELKIKMQVARGSHILIIPQERISILFFEGLARLAEKFRNWEIIVVSKALKKSVRKGRVLATSFAEISQRFNTEENSPKENKPEHFSAVGFSGLALNEEFQVINSQGEEFCGKVTEVSRIGFRGQFSQGQIIKNEKVSILIKRNNSLRSYPAQTVWIKKAGEEFLAGFFLIN